MGRLLRIDVASRTDRGLLRVENQDHFGELSGAGGAKLLVVADGMGGHRGGETASRLAVETIERTFEARGEASEELLDEAFHAANERVYEEGRKRPELYGMGTTCVALLIDPGGAAFVANVGDSRAYRLRGGELEPLTRDHSVVAELARLGLLSDEEASMHPRRNELLRSIGVQPHVEVDHEPVSAEPGDRFLLCSDGLCGVVEDDAIRETLQSGPPAKAARALVDLANAHGGPDNVTVQVIDLETDEP